MTRIEIGRIYVSRIRKFGALVIGCRYSVVVAGVFLGCPGLFLVSVEYVITRVTRLFVVCEHIYHMSLAAGAFVLYTSITDHNSRRSLFLPYMPQVLLFFLSRSSKSQWPPELVVVIGRISYAKGIRDSILGFRVFEVLVELFDS
jgi:hypothetical protein